MPTTACTDPAAIKVTKTVACDPFTPGSSGGTSVSLVDGDTITWAIKVENTGGTSASVDITDTVPAVFTGVTWTRTGPTGTVTTGSGNIAETNVTLAAGLQITYLVEATYEPEACTSLTVNVVTVDTGAEASCCGSSEVYAYSKVFNATPGAPAYRIDPTQGLVAMEVLAYLIESIPLPDKIRVGNFINECGNLADVIFATGGAGDGVASPILDAFGAPTGLYGETTAGA